MKLITPFLGHENATVIVAKYDQQLLLPLLIETTKLLMLTSVEEVEDYNLKVMPKIFFKPLQQM
jgi:hypothetical protein